MKKNRNIIANLLTSKCQNKINGFKARGKYVPQGSIHRESNQNNDDTI